MVEFRMKLVYLTLAFLSISQLCKSFVRLHIQRLPSFCNQKIIVHKNCFITHKLSSNMDNFQEEVSFDFYYLLENQIKAIVLLTKSNYGSLFLSPIPVQLEGSNYLDQNLTSTAMTRFCSFPNDINLDEYLYETNIQDFVESPNKILFENDLITTIPLRNSGKLFGVLRLNNNNMENLELQSEEKETRFNMEVLNCLVDILSGTLSVEIDRNNEIQDLLKVKENCEEVRATSQSSLQSLRTMAKLTKRRINDSDDLGKEMMDNIIVQADFISKQLTALEDPNSNQDNLLFPDLKNPSEHTTEFSIMQGLEENQYFKGSLSNSKNIPQYLF